MIMMTPFLAARLNFLGRMALMGMTVGVPLLAQDTSSPGSTWTFNPGKDAFSPDALLDLRSLNEDVAGASGFVQVDASGQFVLGNGKPARFWAANTDIGKEKNFKATPMGPQEAPNLETHARFLAKRGVNMVRLFSMVTPNANQPIDQPQEDVIDWMQRAVGAMKKQGIYATILPLLVGAPRRWGRRGDWMTMAARLRSAWFSSIRNCRTRSRDGGKKS